MLSLITLITNVFSISGLAAGALSQGRIQLGPDPPAPDYEEPQNQLGPIPEGPELELTPEPIPPQEEVVPGAEPGRRQRR